MTKCQHCAQSLLRAVGGKIKLRNKGVLAFSLVKGELVCEMVCPRCNKDTSAPVRLDDTVAETLAKSLKSPPVTFYIRPPSPPEDS